MDVEGTIIVRDLRRNDVLSNIRINKQVESGFVLFNQKMKDEMFIVVNNYLYIYHTDGALIQSREFDFNVTKGV
jgi:hypothetical protein